jgi:AcrR family transcriptional regulator
VARPQVHSTESIRDAARDQLLEKGARGLTVDAIAAASGAPADSIHHRFGSLEGLLAEMWVAAVRRYQAAFIEAIDSAPEPLEAAVRGAASMCDFASAHPADARLLAAMRWEDLFEGPGSDAARGELEELNASVAQRLAELSRRLFGNAGPAALERTAFAVVDVPHGAVRRHLEAGSPLPAPLPGWIESAVRAALAD